MMRTIPLIRPSGTFSHEGRGKHRAYTITGSPLSPCGRGWIGRQVETGEGFCS